MKVRISRRDTIKLAGAIAPYALGVSTLGGWLFRAAKRRWELPVTAAEAADFEQRFDIRLYNPLQPVHTISEEVRARLGIKAQNGLISQAVQVLLRWNFAEMSVAGQTLEQLPPHLFSSEKGRVTLGIGEYEPLTKDGQGGFKGAVCVCSSGEKVHDFLTGNSWIDASPPVIVYSERDIFHKLFESDVHAKMVIVHECVHMYQNTFAVGKENCLVQEALKLCGADSSIDIHQPCRALADLFSRGCTVERDQNGNVSHVACAPENRLGVIGQSPADLLPVAAELYFAGQEEMCAGFAEAIGDERAERLCRFVQSEVFQGREFRECFAVN